MKFRLLLLPLTAIYSAVMLVRNWFYSSGFLHVSTFTRPVICVGNITVGGTGKTPFIEYLLRLLSDHRPSIVSRGYHRKTKGLVVATPLSQASDIGDEPYQMHSKFPSVPLAVAEDRSSAIRHIIAATDSSVVLMDDGFQHRETKAGFYVLMADYARPMWSDWTFPAGNMREPWAGRHRADIIVVNKCPLSLSEAERDAIVRKMNVSLPVFFTSIVYGALKPLGNAPVADINGRVVAVAGIGRPEPFFDELDRRYGHVVRLPFPDHHNFSPSDVEAILAQATPDAVVITTEKDSTRLPSLGSLPVYYMPIELKVLFGAQDKLNLILSNYVIKNQ